MITLPPESRLAKLRRLQAELTELENEISQEGDSPKVRPSAARPSVLPPRSKIDVVGELSSLRSRLSHASEALDGGLPPVPQKQEDDIVKRLRQLEVDSSEATGKTPAAEEGYQHLPVSDVDRRLSSLEDLVGVATAADQGVSLENEHFANSQIPVSLMDSLSRLDNLLNVLTQPRHLDGISRRVKMLLNDLERAGASARRNAGSSSPEKAAPSALSQADQDTLQSLFALLPRLDPLIPTIPPLITRLRSLSGLHAEALSIAADLRELQSSNADASDEERELNAIVKSVQGGFTEAATGIQKNWEALQGRIQILEGRLERLG